MKIDSTKRLRLRDILVLRVSDADTEDEKSLAEFAEQLNLTTSIPIVILSGNMTLESLSDAQMREAGWVRRRDNGSSLPVPSVRAPGGST